MAVGEALPNVAGPVETGQQAEIQSACLHVRWYTFPLAISSRIFRREITLLCTASGVRCVFFLTGHCRKPSLRTAPVGWDLCWVCSCAHTIAGCSPGRWPLDFCVTMTSLSHPWSLFSQGGHRAMGASGLVLQDLLSMISMSEAKS